MNRRNFMKRGASTLSLIVCEAGCASLWREPGPGMIANFSSVKRGRRLFIEKGVTSNGIFFPTPGSLGYSPKGEGGAAMGGSSDGRQLPEWIEFYWTEYDAARDYRVDELRSLPIQQARVKVRDRVPEEVVRQVIAARRETPPGKLPDKDLWLYFEWADEGIRFHWRFKDSTPNHRKLLAEGGDPVVAK